MIFRYSKDETELKKEVEHRLDVQNESEKPSIDNDALQLTSDNDQQDVSALIRVKKIKKNYSKAFKCDQCDKRYTWYSGLSNHRRFVHKKKQKKLN